MSSLKRKEKDKEKEKDPEITEEEKAEELDKWMKMVEAGKKHPFHYNELTKLKEQERLSDEWDGLYEVNLDAEALAIEPADSHK